MNSKDNVVSMGASANYPAPDTTHMANTASDIGHLSAIANALFIRTDYLPQLNDQFTRLSINIYDTHRDLRDSAIKMTQRLKYSIDDLKTYAVELLEEGLDEQDKADIIAESLRIRTTSMALVKAEDDALNKKLRSVDEKFNRQTTEGFLAGLTADVQRGDADIVQIVGKLAALEDQRKVLNDGITALESKGYAELGKDRIIEVEKLITEGMLLPEIKLIELALEQAKKVIEDIERGITFFALVNARNRLVDTINATREEQIARENDNVMARHRIDFINTLHRMDEQRTVYLSEARKVTQATGFFLSTATTGSMNDQEQVASFIENVIPFNICMSTIAYSPAR